MIENERQHRITRTQADKLAKALKDAQASRQLDPLLRKLEVDALRSQLDELREELQEYRRLRQ